MADLVTHLASALLPGVLLPANRASLLAIGVALPDVGGRLPSIAAESLPFALPPGSLSAFDVLHQPIGLTAAIVATSTLFVPEQRRIVAGWLLSGAALHLAVDLLQDHHGQGYHLAFPLSEWRFELGWIGSESSISWAPWLGLATGVAWAARALVSARGRPAPAARAR